MLSFENARVFLHEKLKATPNIIKHSEAVAQVAFEIAQEIKAKHPGVKLNSNKVRLLGLLHDVGRAETCGPDHPLASKRLLEELGHKKLGLSVARHGFSFEVSEKDGTFLPKTLEEKIMNYADSVVAGGKKVGFEQRAADWRVRHEGKADFDYGNEAFVRLEKIVREVEALLNSSSAISKKRRLK